MNLLTRSTIFILSFIADACANKAAYTNGQYANYSEDIDYSFVFYKK